MSFSSQVKKELLEVIPSASHCRLAEVAAMESFLGKLLKKNEKSLISLEEASPEISAKYFTLQKKTISIIDARGGFVANPGSAIDDQILQQTCCKCSFLRGAFLCAGSMSDPMRGYHLEIVCLSEAQAKQVMRAFEGISLTARVTQRKGRYVVYLKESEHIIWAIGQMGAHKSLMELENVKILKDMRNDLNRKVNCEAANISKTVGAAWRQLEDIRFLQERGALGSLPENLQEAAELRSSYPDMPLAQLGALCDPPVGKSGINHRLRRLSAAADKLRGSL